MRTLKELVELQWLTGASDEEIITQWLLENNVAEKGIEIISQLATRKIKSQQETLTWKSLILSLSATRPTIGRRFRFDRL